MKPLRIVTRKSKLALWQAEFVKQQLQMLHPKLSIEIIGVLSAGDKTLDSLAKMGGKGLFVKELEDALLNNEADLAVHSMKDVPAILPQGLTIAATLKRADARDALVCAQFATLADIPPNSVIGTSSIRRQAQLLHVRPDLKVASLRGNVDTRLKKLESGEFTAIILAVAGLERLGCSEFIAEILQQNQLLPCMGQGALGIECRIGDENVRSLVAPLNDPDTEHCLMAERSLVQALKGNCQSPIAAYAVLTSSLDNIILQGRVISPEGKTLLHAQTIGKREEAEKLGQQVAFVLESKGAEQIIQACQH